MKVIACIPAHGRLPLLKHTIERLLKKNGCSHVIVAGETKDEQKVIEDAGGVFVKHANKPLGMKWNAAFKGAKEFNPDACLFVGSGDWLSDNWIHKLEPQMDHSDMVGKPDFYMLDIETKRGIFRACHWAGYDNERKGESIGIGRMISRQILTRLNWEPFDSKLDKNMDYSMRHRVKATGGTEMLLEDPWARSLSLSCDQWGNKHSFNSHWTQELKSDIVSPRLITNEFPEALKIFNIENPDYLGI